MTGPIRVSYGSDDDQWAELHRPAAPILRPRVAVLVHGGFWQSQWTAALMQPMAVDLVGRGWYVWNLEYRRPDRWSWDDTTADLAAGLNALAPTLLDCGLDEAAVVGIGHSAGAQLIVRATADLAENSAVEMGAVVSLAGIVDVSETYRRDLGDGAVRRAFGGSPEEVPGRYAASDPMRRLPLRVPQLVVQGADDAPDLVEMSRDYADAARAAGDVVVHLELPGDHFAVIDPGSAIWAATLDEIDAMLLDPTERPGGSASPAGYDQPTESG